MKFRVHQKLEEAIKNEERDIALIAAPGMGLSTLMSSLTNIRNAFAIFIPSKTLLEFWETEFKDRSYNKRFVIHAATIDALINSGLINAKPERDYIIHTNLQKFWGDYNVGDLVADKLYLVIDDFDELPNDLEKIILDEFDLPQFLCPTEMRV